MTRALCLFLGLFSFSVVAGSLSQSFPAGSGAAYRLKMKNDATPILLSIYVTNTRVDSVNIEYFLETKGLVPVQMWQQFEIGVSEKGPAQIKNGFVLTKELAAPEKMTPDYLRGAAGGVQVNDFLFSNKAQLEKDKVGEELVEIAAGSTRATHYRTVNNGQTVDYWISSEARPMGLVMLVSKSEKNPQQNYGLELTHIIENIKPKILPETAVPLTAKGKGFLAKPESVR